MEEYREALPFMKLGTHCSGSVGDVVQPDSQRLFLRDLIRHAGFGLSRALSDGPARSLHPLDVQSVRD
jgi:hypothetical protein